MTDIVLLPGVLCDQRLWAAAADGLAATTHFPDFTAGDTIPAMAEMVLSQAPQRFALAGFSLGGAVAFEVFARAPQRVTRLALLSGAVQGLPEIVRQHFLRWIPLIESGGLGDYLADAFPGYIAPGRVHDRALWEVFAAMGKAMGAAVAVRQMQALLAYPGYGGELGTIRCPVAIIGGAEDRHATPEAHTKLSHQIPRAVLTIIAGAAHFTPLETPEAVKESLRDLLARK